MEPLPGAPMEVEDEEEDFTYTSSISAPNIDSEANPEDTEFDLIIEKLQ